MPSRLRTYKKKTTRTETPDVSTAPVQGMFELRPFGVQLQQAKTPEQPLDLNTELSRAQLYGHNLTQMQWTEPASATSVQPKKRRGKPLPSQPQTEPLLQAKLTMGEPGDKYKQEADRVASQVVQQINAPAPQQSTQSQSVQRNAMPDEKELMKKSERGIIQREEKSEEDEELQMKPAVQLQASGGGMAVTDELESNIQQARGGGQTLADNVREPIEQVFGADFSGVKVHTDSQADQLNRATQARAFTTGQDVFFRQGEYNPASRGGQELIAHELTHIVQQNGEAVQRSPLAPQQLPQHPATETLSVSVGGGALKAKGEIIGNRQVSSKEQSQNPNAPSGQLVVQRLASQIIPNFSAGEGDRQKATSIHKVQIIGRPEKVFSDTMGDHTTAFAVHQEALKQQLEGKGFREAFGVIQSFYNAALNLPGSKLRDGLPKNHKERLTQAETTLKTLLETQSDLPSDQTISALQQTVGAYLEFRELIPLSTINVKVKDPVVAGKGKAEASKVNTLLAHQKGEQQSAGARKEAIVGLFDASSVALAIVEQDGTMLSKMLPGLGGRVALEERMEMIIEQHLLSIKQGFPSVFDKDLTEVDTKGALNDALKVQMKDWLIATAEYLKKQCDRYENDIKNQENQKIVSSKRSHERIDKEIANLRNKADEENEKLKVLEKEYQNFFDKKLNISNPDEEMGRADVEELDEEENLHSIKRQRRSQSDMEEDTEESVEAAETPALVDEENEDAEERKSPLAIQIVLNPAGEIAAIHSAGRTPSPFPGTMGAHTTAWIVHIDRVRKALIKNNPTNAIGIVKNLVKEANQLEEKRQNHFRIDSEHEELLSSAKTALNEFPDLTQYDSAGQLLGLQQYVDKLLTYINYIPGSTLEVTDTRGRSEGQHRKVLMDFENGGKATKQELEDAIKGLLDCPNTLEDNQKKLLEEQHREMIKATYTKAFEALYDNKHQEQIIPSTNNGKKRKIRKRKRDE